MVLTKHEILSEIKSGGLAFSPELDQFQVQPHAVDLRLGFEFRLARTWELTKQGRKAVNVDPLDKKVDNFEVIKLDYGQYFELLPKEFVIAVTLEEIAINADNLMAVLYPRSSINRRGLSVDLSGIIDVGYKGRLVIPIMNNTNEQVIRVYPGERICQIVFEELATSLNAEEAQLHGLSKAKYHQSEHITIKPDSDIEKDLIRKGEIDKLKHKYRVEA